MPKPKTYFIFTFGCQMNKSDAERVAGDYEARGYVAAKTVDQADEIVINTCSIRKSAEDRARSLVNNLAKKFKQMADKPKTVLTRRRLEEINGMPGFPFLPAATHFVLTALCRCPGAGRFRGPKKIF